MPSPALRCRDVHLNALFASDHFNGPLFTHGASGSTLDPIAATEIDATPWPGQRDSDAHGGANPSNFRQLPGMEGLHSTDQLPTASAQGETILRS